MKDREPLLTFVVAGGGFAGVETIGSIKDFLNDALPCHPNLKSDMIRVVLVHPGDFVLQELGENLGRYASRKLAERGVQLRGNTKVSAVAQREVKLSDGINQPSTAGQCPAASLLSRKGNVSPRLKKMSHRCWCPQSHTRLDAKGEHHERLNLPLFL